MAELDLKQIVDKLNTEFIGQHRKLVFWYDDKGDFAEDIDSVELTNSLEIKSIYNRNVGAVFRLFGVRDLRGALCSGCCLTK